MFVTYCFVLYEVVIIEDIRPFKLLSDSPVVVPMCMRQIAHLGKGLDNLGKMTSETKSETGQFINKKKFKCLTLTLFAVPVILCNCPLPLFSPCMQADMLFPAEVTGDIDLLGRFFIGLELGQHYVKVRSLVEQLPRVQQMSIADRKRKNIILRSIRDNPIKNIVYVPLMLQINLPVNNNPSKLPSSHNLSDNLLRLSSSLLSAVRKAKMAFKYGSVSLALEVEQNCLQMLFTSSEKPARAIATTFSTRQSNGQKSVFIDVMPRKRRYIVWRTRHNYPFHHCGFNFFITNDGVLNIIEVYHRTFPM
ncbi:hypothetical protein NQ317_016901 [Molorchus minor]|uniref:Uncharacterized protein n=1 Tax=Molorchus minor TaxID=1323400 RepID=A0ABQ9K3T6_9CUCU|nr:hypothetical protein NQ317_016901 [Molorchus minor]